MAIRPKNRFFSYIPKKNIVVMPIIKNQQRQYSLYLRTCVPDPKQPAMAGNRTRVNCLEGSYAHHYTTIARYRSYHDNICKKARNILHKFILSRKIQDHIQVPLSVTAIAVPLSIYLYSAQTSGKVCGQFVFIF